MGLSQFKLPVNKVIHHEDMIHQSRWHTKNLGKMLHI